MQQFSIIFKKIHQESQVLLIALLLQHCLLIYNVCWFDNGLTIVVCYRRPYLIHVLLFKDISSIVYSHFPGFISKTRKIENYQSFY